MRDRTWTWGPSALLFLLPSRDKYEPRGFLHPDSKACVAKGCQLPKEYSSGGRKKINSTLSSLNVKEIWGAVAVVFLNLFALTTLGNIHGVQNS